MTARPARIPHGVWPPLMPADLAAGYCGEPTADAFLRNVGKRWPEPFKAEGTGKGRYQVWRKLDLDRVIQPELVDAMATGDPAPL